MSDEPSPMPGSPVALERVIQERRDHLAATIDELTARANPAAIAQHTVGGLKRKLQTLTHGADGELRTERLGAVAGAAVVIVGVLIVLRRRR